MSKKPMTKETAISRINTFGNIGKVLSIIGIVFLSIVLVCSIAGTIAINVIPDEFLTLKVNGGMEVVCDVRALDPDVSMEEMEKVTELMNNDSVSAGVNLGAAHIELNEGYLDDAGIGHFFSGNATKDIKLSDLSSIMYALLVTLALTIVTLVFALRLSKAFEKCSSPFDETVIKRLKEFAFSLIPWALVENIPDAIVSKTFTQSMTTINVDYNVVFVVLIVLALSVVFRYGAMLQQESDETL